MGSARALGAGPMGSAWPNAATLPCDLVYEAFSSRVSS